MKGFYLLLLLVFSLQAFSQTYLPLTDDMEIGSNSDIKILGGNYSVNDGGNEGIIRIINQENVVIDGDSVNVSGNGFTGFLIKIFNSKNIIIKNFDSGTNFYYCVKATGSQNIIINDCNFYSNKVDSVGFIDVWADSTGSLGGGVYMADCDSARIYNDTMNLQNDGVALYHCRHIIIYNNLFSWNTSYGIRMFRSDSCNIHHNVSAHINRPLTDPSDAAAILMIISNENNVEYNDFTYSGDGVFLGQYGWDEIPNNNYFAWNDCSFSPHNAFEATFAQGNIYKHNIANYSWFGFWLGYSFDSVIDSNEVSYNSGYADDFGGGIAIDRGFNNSITNNNFTGNSNAVKLWEGSPASGYTGFSSHDYIISNNSFTDNKIAVYNHSTERMSLNNNLFENNLLSVYLTGNCDYDSITFNQFVSGSGFFIKNESYDPIGAANNTFPGDSAYVSCKIFDHDDTATSGPVNWYPCTFIPDTFIYQYQAPDDLNEMPAVWDHFLFVEGHQPTTVTWDENEKVTGDQSVHIISESGYNVTIHYTPPDNIIPQWLLGETDTLIVWCKAVIDNPDNQWGFQDNFFRLGTSNCNGSGYYDYTNDCYATGNYIPCVMNECIDQWIKFEIPLAGNSDWVRTSSENPDLSSVSYVEFNADVWDYGFEMWVDGLSFTDHATGMEELTTGSAAILSCCPNPSKRLVEVRYCLNEPGYMQLQIFDLYGKLVCSLYEGSIKSGIYTQTFDGFSYLPGIYSCRLIAGNSITTAKIVLLK